MAYKYKALIQKSTGKFVNFSPMRSACDPDEPRVMITNIPKLYSTDIIFGDLIATEEYEGLFDDEISDLELIHVFVYPFTKKNKELIKILTQELDSND
jgi:hypothetical protein